MKRILLVLNRFLPQIGGAELLTSRLAQELAKHFEVDLITPLRDLDPQEEVMGDLRVCRVHNLRNPLCRYPDRAARTLCPQVFSQVLKGGYALVHCFPSPNANSVLAAMAAKISGIPAVLTIFDLFDYGAFLNAGGSIGDIPGLRPSLRQRTALRMFDGIFTISQRETELIRQENPRTYMSTVPVDLKEFDEPSNPGEMRERLGLSSDQKLILCLSRIARLKGQDVFLRALAKLRERRSDFVGVIVGRTDFEPAFFQELQQSVKTHGLEAHVRFTGPLARRDVIAALHACAFHVLPQRYMNSGAVVVETWAARRAPIQSRNIDPSYTIDGRNGYTFDPCDVAMLTDRMNSLLDSPALADRMGEEGRALVEQGFLYSHLVSLYRGVYSEMGVPG